MDLQTLAQIGLEHASAALPEILYLKSGIDLTRPTLIRGIVNERCNYKCLQCGCWRLDRYDEITIQQWKDSLASVKDYLGAYTIQFSGGEPFVKKGFLDLLEFCRREAINFGLITNGSTLAIPRVASRLVATRPLKLDVSVDGPTPEIHDRLRGAPGSLDAIRRGINAVRAEQERAGVHFPVRIKPTINAVNFRSMPALVSWTVEVGASSIDFQPITGWTEESGSELWPKSEEIPALKETVAVLIELKSRGAPIETSEHNLRSLPGYFVHEKVAPQFSICRVGLRQFNIDPRGIVTTCPEYGPIGDITKESARAIWEGFLARENRRRTAACTKGCPFGCGPKPFLEKIGRGLMLLRRG
jgi:MoaA/NifB/PqqE/SkfB family radical SAM enzyme